MENDNLNHSSSACVSTQDKHQACPVCNDSDHLKILCQVDGFDILACGNCSTGHAFPVPSSRELKAYYDRHEWFDANEKGGYQDYDAQTGWSVDLLKELLDEFDSPQGASILDVGCGYGTHLAAAAERGWKCFGVELSDHARKVARERLGDKACIVESVADLIPHEFDLILLLDVIEHLASPYGLFYQLFSIGAITPKTRVVITTPNAGSEQAKSDPAGWPYLHPPSHLVYYTAESLAFLLRRLHFSEVSIRGHHACTDAVSPDALSAFDGLLTVAQGSDFTEFMRERYVPGTWSKIAEYEHLPRYALTRTFAAGKKVLDFGCGTGYGSAILAEVAASVTALDIDEPALTWARESHRNARLHFIRSTDLGAGLPAASFDLISCFEMIEHVGHATQQAVIASFGRLLQDDGLLIISTPNPEVTQLYGENPYHLREMSEAEFLELLHAEFPHVLILRQRACSCVTFDQESRGVALTAAPIRSRRTVGEIPPLAFIAFCSRQPLPEIPDPVFFDEEADPVREYLDHERLLNRARFDAYAAGEKIRTLEHELDAYRVQADEFARQVGAFQSKQTELQAKLTELSDWRSLAKRLLKLLLGKRTPTVKAGE